MLVIDDSPQIADLLDEVLTACGARVAKVHSGRGASVALTLGLFDLVLLDLYMPRPNGWDLLRLLRRVRPDLLARTILITGDRFDRREDRLLAHAHLPVLYKPFEIGQVRALACRTLAAAPPPSAAALAVRMTPSGPRWRSDASSRPRCA